MGIRHIMGYKVRGVPLYVIGISGLAGVLVDLDHLIAYPFGLDGRFLHTPLLIGSGIVLLGCGAYLGRLYSRMVLN